MLQIRKILKLLNEKRSFRKISELTGIHRNTINEYLQCFEKTGLSYKELLKLKDEQLAESLFSERKVDIPDERKKWLEDKTSFYLQELKRTGVTRKLLWEEYLSEQPEGYRYSQFCEHLARFKEARDITLDLIHLPGERLEIDFAGKSLSYVNQSSGEIVNCPVLVCTLSYSAYCYVEPLVSSTQEHLIPALNRAMEYFGGVPKVILSDNMAQVVKRACKYEPVFTELMDQWALHYQTDLKATRVKKPKDKPKVEGSVNIAYQQIYARLRNDIFFNINDLKRRGFELLEELNSRKMYKKEFSRKELFEKDEKHLLLPLPGEAFVLKHKTHGKVKRNYSVILGEDWHQYMVPYQYVGQEVDLVYDEDTVEIFLKNFKRIAIYKRNYQKNGYSRTAGFLPESHKRYLEQKGWTGDDFIEKASRVGEYTVNAISSMLASKTFIEQTYDGCLGLLRLGNKYSDKRLEAACKRAVDGHLHITYRTIKNILENNQDKLSQLSTQLNLFIPPHENIRGAEEYK